MYVEVTSDTSKSCDTDLALDNQKTIFPSFFIWGQRAGCGPREGVQFEAQHLPARFKPGGRRISHLCVTFGSIYLAFIKLNVKVGPLCVENCYQNLLKEYPKVMGLGMEGNGSLCSLTQVTEVSFSGKQGPTEINCLGKEGGKCFLYQPKNSQHPQRGGHFRLLKGISGRRGVTTSP